MTLEELLLTPWSDEHKAAIEDQYQMPLRNWFHNGTPGPFVVDYHEHAETFVPRYDFFPQWNDGKAVPTGFVDRQLSVRRGSSGQHSPDRLSVDLNDKPGVVIYFA